MEKLITAGFTFEAEELYFKTYNLALDERRRSFMEAAKQDKEFISKEVDIIDYFQTVMDVVSEIADHLRTRFIFKTSDRSNSGIFSAWIVRQVTITLNEAISQMSDDLLSSTRGMISLHRRLIVAAGNYDVKGVSVSFVVDDFFDR